MVYLSFTNLISVAYLIIRSLISKLYGFYLVRLSATELVDSSSGRSLDGEMIWSSFGGVFEVFAVFGCNF